MINVSVDVNLDYDEILDACNRHDKKELLIELLTDGFIEKLSVSDKRDIYNTLNDTGLSAIVNKLTLVEQTFQDNISLIAQNRLQLTIEEEELINQLAKRFI